MVIHFFREFFVFPIQMWPRFVLFGMRIEAFGRFLLRCWVEMLAKAGGSLCLYSMVNQRLVAVFVVSTIKNG